MSVCNQFRPISSVSDYLLTTAPLCFSEDGCRCVALRRSFTRGQLYAPLPPPSSAPLERQQSHLLSLMMSSRCVNGEWRGPHANPTHSLSILLPPAARYLTTAPSLPLALADPPTPPPPVLALSGQCGRRAADAGQQRKQAYLRIIS